jgi:hypothetical protein
LVQLDEQCGRRGTAGLAGDVQLRVDVRQVSLDRPDAQGQAVGDRLVRQALRHELEHLELAPAEAGASHREAGRRVRAKERLDL